MDRREVLDRVLRLLRERLGVGNDGQPLGEDSGLLGHGIGLDSVEVLQLVAHIEEEFELTIDDEDLDAEHFRTVGSVISFLQERLP